MAETSFEFSTPLRPLNPLLKLLVGPDSQENEEITGATYLLVGAGSALFGSLSGALSGSKLVYKFPDKTMIEIVED